MANHDRVYHHDVIKWRHIPRPRSPVNSPHKGQWPGALMFSLICVWINSWVNNGQAGDLGRNRSHYDVTVMICHNSVSIFITGNKHLFMAKRFTKPIPINVVTWTGFMSSLMMRSIGFFPSCNKWWYRIQYFDSFVARWSCNSWPGGI